MPDDKLSPQEQIWFNSFGLTVRMAEEENKLKEAKGKVIGDIAGEMDRLLPEIKKGMDFAVDEKTNGLEGAVRGLLNKPKRMRAIDPKGDDMKAIDTWHDLPGLNSIDPDVLKAAGKSMSKLLELTDRMRDAKGEDGKPLFTDAEIAAEIWTPLYRQGAIGENFIPDKYSYFKSYFEGSVKEYQVRLNDYSKDLGENANSLRGIGVAKDILGRVQTLGNNIISTVGGPAEATAIMTTIFAVGDGALTVSEQVLKKEDISSILKTVANAAVSAVGGYLPPEVASYLGPAVKTALGSATIIEGIAEKDASKALQGLVKAMSGAVATAETACGDNKKVDDALDLVAKALKNGKNFPKQALTLGKAIKKGDKDGITAALIDVTETVLKTASGEVDTVLEQNEATLGKNAVQMGELINELSSDFLIGVVGAVGSDDPVKSIIDVVTQAAVDGCADFVPAGDEAILKPILTAMTQAGNVVTAIRNKDVKGLAKALGAGLAGAVAESNLLSADNAGGLADLCASGIEGISPELLTLGHELDLSVEMEKAFKAAFAKLQEKLDSLSQQGGSDGSGPTGEEEGDGAKAVLERLTVLAAGLRKDMVDSCEPFPPSKRKGLQAMLVLSFKIGDVASGLVKDSPKGSPEALAEAIGLAYEQAATGAKITVEMGGVKTAVAGKLSRFESVFGNEDAIRAAIGEGLSASLRKIAANLPSSPQDQKEKDQEQKVLQDEVDKAGKDAEQDISLLKSLDQQKPSGTDKARAQEQALHEIQPLIDKLNKSKKILATAEKLADLGIGLAVKFFPPASAAKDFKKFAVETMKAVKHAQALLEWLDHKDMSKKARSPVLEAVKNRVGNEERQSLEHSIQASLSLLAGLAKVIGTAVPMAQPAVLAGEAINLLQSGIDIGSSVLTEIQMAQAWSSYKKAIATPQDRKQARLALQQNPTLAKYAIAYGAYSAEDPAAKQIANRCGLSFKVLQNPKTNVQNVVKYMEALFDEDPVLLRAVTVPQKWHPGKPELTAASWASFQVAAQSKARPPLDNPDKGPVAAALVGLAAADKALKEAIARGNDAPSILTPEQLSAQGALGDGAMVLTDGVGLDQDALNGYVDALDTLQGALNTYRPKTGDGSAHEEMQSYIDTLLAQVELRRRSLPKTVIQKVA